MIFGKRTLVEYYENYKDLWGHENELHLEKRFKQVECEGVPISGILDKVEVYKDYIIVVDYKTGKVENAKRLKKLNEPKDEDDPGGDYWRQIVFYKLLIDHDPSVSWHMKKRIYGLHSAYGERRFF